MQTIQKSIKTSAGRPTKVVSDPHENDRRRVSGPSFLAFLSLADAWHLTDAQKENILACPDRRTYAFWLAQSGRPNELILPAESLRRISAFLGIYKALKTVSASGRLDIAKWLETPHVEAPFEGRQPLEIIASGDLQGLLDIRAHLESLN